MGDAMIRAEQKIAQYLNEAHATETGLISQLQVQIAMSPEGSYRTGLERHLSETREHAQRVQARLGELGGTSNPFLAGLGMAETLMGQWLAVAKAPIDLMRGTGGEEKLLKNAKDSCAAEALEIATYTAIEELAGALGDAETAKLAASIRADEERMLALLMKEIPKLTAAVVRADVHGERSYDVTKTGAAQAARTVGEAATGTRRRGARTAGKAAEAGADAAQRGTGTTRRAKTGAARTTRGTGRRATAARRSAARPTGAGDGGPQDQRGDRGVSDLPIAGYDTLNADEVVAKLKPFRKPTSPKSGPTSAPIRAARRSATHRVAARGRALAWLRRPDRRGDPHSPRRRRRGPRPRRA